VVTSSELGTTGPLKARVSKWAIANGVKMPGAVSVAEHILGKHETKARAIKIKASRKRTLQSIHGWAMKTFELTDPAPVTE
jgi:hypothetical protein